MTIWKNQIVLFGGFYDVNVKIQYMDDLWVFDISLYEWKKIELKNEMNKPSARSGSQFFTHNDQCVLINGYTKVQIKGEKCRGVTFQEVWCLKMDQDLSKIRWERKKNSGFIPSKRSGGTLVYHKGKGVMFGGVEDLVDDDETLESVCLNDMFSYNLDSNRWFPQTLRTVKQKKKKVKQKQQNKRNNNDDDWSDKEEPQPLHDLTENLAEVIDENDLDSRELSPVLFPWPRFNAMMCIVKNILYIYGGILETKSREYFLGDFWSINLDKMLEWNCIIYDEMERKGKDEWKGDESSDDEEEKDDSDDDDEDEDQDDEDEEDEKARKKEIRVKQDEYLKQKNDNQGVPQPGEKLGPFFSRTIGYWQLKTFDVPIQVLGGMKTSKAIRRGAFEMARTAWEDWQPKLEELKKFLEEEGEFKEESKVLEKTREDDGKRSRRFNLTGLNTEVKNYALAYDLITDNMDSDFEDDELRLEVEKSSRHLYGLIHSRFIVTNAGISKMFEKFKYGEFGSCPRVLCSNQPCLPIGISDQPGSISVKLYCPRCEDIYCPPSKRHHSTDGAYFGTTFPHLFLQIHPELVPDKTEVMENMYMPRVFGFNVHELAEEIRVRKELRDQGNEYLKRIGGE